MSTKSPRTAPKILGIFAAGLMAATALTASIVLPATNVNAQSQIQAPATVDPSRGVADLVQRVMPAVVSVQVEFANAAANADQGNDQQATPDMPQDSPFRVVRHLPAHADIVDLIRNTRTLIGEEGYVVRFKTGHMLKIKADEYVRVHKIKDLIRTDRNILDLMLNEQLDDALGVLDEEDCQRIMAYEQVFWNAFDEKLTHMYNLVQTAKIVYGSDKKRVALEMKPNLKNQADARFIFAALDGKDLRDELIKHAKNCLGGETKYGELMEYMK